VQDPGIHQDSRGPLNRSWLLSHEILFRIFVLSCFRDIFFVVPGIKKIKEITRRSFFYMTIHRDIPAKIVLIALIIGGIVYLHFFTIPELRHHHAVYRMLFYLPLILGSFWFGLKGAISVSAIVFILFLPYVVKHWQGWSFEDFDRLLEMTLYIVIAFILGFLSEKERRGHKALRQSESLAAVGYAVSEVAHDMKTPLMAIGGFTRQVARTLDQDGPNRKKLGVVIQETGRLESMVKEMLDFGKPLEIRPLKTDLNELMLDAVKVAQPLAKKAGVALKIDLTSPSPPLLLDGPKIRQVLINLLTNAVQASPAGEQIWVRTFRTNSRANVEVADCGCGIKKEDQERVFKPFFSSKRGGTGLGLAITKKIVEAHGGEVSFSPNPEKGVTFTLRFFS